MARGDSLGGFADPVAAAKGPSDIVQHLASGAAALIAVECLLFRLMDRRLLTPADIIEVIEAALATERQMVADGEHAEIATVAIARLSVLINSVAAVSLKGEPS